MMRFFLYSTVAAWLFVSFLMLPASAAPGTERRIAEQQLDCVINPSVVADLGSGVPGILSKIRVDRSDQVNAGDVIAELESGVEIAALDLARTRAELTAEVDLRKVNAAFGQRQNKRTKDLFQRKAISTNDMDQRQTEARLAHIQLRQARDNQDLAKLERLRAEEILKRRTIKSPIAGVVMERFKVVGEYVEDQPVVRVAQIDPLHVEVIVPIEQLGMVRKGMYAEVWSDVVQDTKWYATVDRVDQVADVASGTYGVRLTLPNPEHRIPAGLRCRMQLVEKPAEPTEASTAEAATTAPDEFADSTPDREDAESQSFADVMDVPEDVRPAQQSVNHDRKNPEPEETVQPAVAAESPAIVHKPARKLPAGFKAIERKAVVVEAVVPQAPVVAEVTDRPKAIRVREEAIEQVADAATVEQIEPDPDQLEADLIADVDELDDAEPVVDALPVCHLAGPYRDEVKATRKVVKLRRAGLNVDIKSVPVSTSDGYMIATPVQPNRAQAKALVAKLKAAGITDLYLPRRSSKPLRISLGLYNGKKIANRQIRKFAKMGFTTELLPWKRKGSQYFLVIRGASSDSDGKLLSSLPVPDRSADSTQGFCNQLAGR